MTSHLLRAIAVVGAVLVGVAAHADTRAAGAPARAKRPAQGPARPHALAPRSAASTTAPERRGLPPICISPLKVDELARDLGPQRGEDDLAAALTSGKIALAPFELIGVADATVARDVLEDMTTALYSYRRLVERNQMERALRTLKLTPARLTEPQALRQVAKLTGCTHVITGSISDRGALVVIHARLLDAKTGQIVKASYAEMPRQPAKNGQ